MSGSLRHLPRSFERCTLAEKLQVAAANIEQARNMGVAEHLAGWEHLVIREALERLTTPAPEKPDALDERVKVLEAALENARLAFMAIAANGDDLDNRYAAKHAARARAALQGDGA